MITRSGSKVVAFARRAKTIKTTHLETDLAPNLLPLFSPVADWKLDICIGSASFSILCTSNAFLRSKTVFLNEMFNNHNFPEPISSSRCFKLKLPGSCKTRRQQWGDIGYIWIKKLRISPNWFMSPVLKSSCLTCAYLQYAVGENRVRWRI